MYIITNTAGSIISLTTIISIAYIASPDSSDSLKIIIYFLRRKYHGGKAAKGLTDLLLRPRLSRRLNLDSR